ncbi:claudin-4-like [Hippocampus comes]|uniref:claudin-4-like n=1 Tax=Hippocampus comes TaxID=109280 RepID=UPI00094E008F|nr:PREDICTED: claudin-4-like [Hippocampus comes]XP_019752204.1 PREDICTED: claudin-4-like [Hippocampus comes]
MASTGTQLLGSGLCLLGWAGVIICCLLPMWRVTAFVGSTIVTSQTIWEGIWMSCVVQSTGQIQCKPYESTLALSADLQAARALTVLAAATGAAGLLLAFVGGKCTRFLEREGPGPKGRVAAAAGALLVLAGALCLIPTAWAAGAVVRKFYAASVDAQRRELGACLYVGWGASVLLVLGGGLFIGGARPLEARGADGGPSVRYLMVRSSAGSLRRVPAGTVFSGPPSYRTASAKSEPTGEAAWGRVGQNSERSRAPSAGSQLKRMDSTPSERSDAPSAESQLKPDERDRAKALDSDGSRRDSEPSKTYL